MTAMRPRDDAIDRPRDAEALVQDDRGFRVLAEAIPSIVWVAAPDGTITYANRRWFEYAGITPEQNARNWPELVLHPEDRERCVRAWKQALAAGSEYEIEVRNRRHDGAYRWFITRATPLRGPHGELVSWIGVTTDIHDQKLATERLREADRRKDEFLAVLAHELRNPLAPILNAAELLRRLGGEHPQILHARDMIERQAQQLSKLVDDLLDIARITRNMVKLNTDKVQLERVVTDAVDASRPLIESKLHELTLELCDEQLIVVGDHARLTQVVTNLLNNAAKYTDPGGHIRVVLERGQGEALIRVIDDGVGMTPELIGRAFDAFSHPEHAFDRAQGGLGIGLTLVRRLIELHGGSVVAASAGSGTGSEFTVRLPLLCAELETPQFRPSEAKRPEPRSRRRVLVVDDNVDAAESLATLLDVWGHETRVAHDGARAMALARDFQPEVALLDIGLPDTNGYELASELRRTAGLEGTLLIALTGYGQEQDQKRAREVGFSHHLVKPANFKTIQKLLAEFDGSSS